MDSHKLRGPSLIISANGQTPLVQEEVVELDDTDDIFVSEPGDIDVGETEEIVNTSTGMLIGG